MSKFGATYDAVSEKFYALTNTVLPVHANDPNLPEHLVGKPEMIRNTATVLSSKDLRHWDVEKIFLYSQNIGYEAFQYMNLDFDGQNMVIASRTAFDTRDEELDRLPPRGHDSNLFTFHIVENFRTMAPDQLLVADPQNNQVLRHARNGGNDWAPLGTFTLGSSFDGAPLNQPVDLAQDPGGNVFVREQLGRILEFDAAGNFQGVVASAPIPFQGTEISVQQPAAGERSWINAGSGDWFQPRNWYYWGRPGTEGEIALFGTGADSDSAIEVNHEFTVKGLRFRNAHEYTLGGSGGITIEADTGNGVIDLQLGDHEVDVAVQFGSDAIATAEDGTNLRFRKRFDLDGRALILNGRGRLRVYDEFVMNGGTLVVDGEAIFTFGSTANATLDGTIRLQLGDGVIPSIGDKFDLLNGIGYVDDTFHDVLLPELLDGLFWDMATFYANGEITVAATSDFDADGDVDGKDFLTWQSGFGVQSGAVRSNGDADGDGDVDRDDFRIWQIHFGATSGASSTAAVPEPPNLMIAVTALLVALAILTGRVGSARGRRREALDFGGKQIERIFCLWFGLA